MNTTDWTPVEASGTCPLCGDPLGVGEPHVHNRCADMENAGNCASMGTQSQHRGAHAHPPVPTVHLDDLANQAA
jgi:hypothetical protein